MHEISIYKQLTVEIVYIIRLEQHRVLIFATVKEGCITSASLTEVLLRTGITSNK